VAYGFQVALNTVFGYSLGFNLIAEAPTVIEPLLAAYLLYRLIHVPPQFAGLREVTLFAVCVIGAAMCSAFLGAGIQASLGFSYWPAWLSWFLSAGVTSLVLAPAIVLWAAARPASWRILGRQFAVELVIWSGLFVLLGVVAQLWLHGQANTRALILLPVPLLLWAAVRFGPRGLVSALTLLAIAAIVGVAYGLGPFSGLSVGTSVLTVQLFLAAIGVPLLFLAALVQERERAGRALLASEARYRRVVESQTELIAHYLPDTTLTFVNEANCRSMGLSREQLLGTQFLDILVDAAREPVVAMIDSLLKHPGAVTLEHQVRVADGSRRWYQWVNRTILDQQGRVIELQGIGRDITERKHLEQALQESEARYRDLVESQPDLICRFQTDGTLTFVTAAFGRHYRHPPEELIGRCVVDVMDVRRRDGFIDHLAALVAQPHTAVDEHVYMRHDGSTGWLQWIDHPILDASGKLVEFQAVGRDITERKRAEEALRESEARFREAFESSATGMILVDPAG
jgi:PAS domain S-box-containing protein